MRTGLMRSAFLLPVKMGSGLISELVFKLSTEPTHKGVHWCSKDVTQVQQQRPELPTVTLTWHVCK